MTESQNPSLPKSAWIDRCMTRLGRLKPEMSILEAQTVAMNILWSEDPERSPEQVATAWVEDFATLR